MNLKQRQEKARRDLANTERLANLVASGNIIRPVSHACPRLETCKAELVAIGIYSGKIPVLSPETNPFMIPVQPHRKDINV